MFTRSSVTDMLSNLDWVPLSERRCDARLTMRFKIINDLIAIPAGENLTKSSSRTRSGASNSYRKCTTNTSTYANSFPSTIKDWNSLPIDIKAVESLDQFNEGLASRDPERNTPNRVCSVRNQNQRSVLLKSESEISTFKIRIRDQYFQNVHLP